MGVTDSLQPDWGEIEAGNPRAIADAMAFLYGKLNEEAKQRFLADLQRAPLPEQDWLLLSKALKGSPDSGLISSNRIITHTVRVYRDSVQSINSGVRTKVQFASVSLDNYTEWDSSNYRLIPKLEGIWVFFTIIGMANVSGRLDLELAGTANLGKGLVYPGAASDISSWAYDISYMNGSTDYTEVYVTHSTGAARDVQAGTDDSFLVATHLGLAN